MCIRDRAPAEPAEPTPVSEPEPAEEPQPQSAAVPANGRTVLILSLIHIFAYALVLGVLLGTIRQRTGRVWPGKYQQIKIGRAHV